MVAKPYSIDLPPTDWPLKFPENPAGYSLGDYPILIFRNSLQAVEYLSLQIRAALGQSLTQGPQHRNINSSFDGLAIYQERYEA
jgi:hypothetical protein